MDGLKYLFLEDRDQPLPSWVAELEDVLGCPVCLKTFLDPPIYQCENGHCFCSNCHESLKKEGQECPVCRGQLTKARCLAVEKMLEKLPKAKCRYEDCQFKRAEVEVVHQHETDCLFRLVECGVCKEGIPLSSIAGHLEVAHEIRTPLVLQELETEESFTSSNSGLFDQQQPLKCDDLTFFVNQKHYNNDLMMFWISFCGSKKQAEEYEYTFKIESSADKKAGREKYLFYGSKQCVSCDVSHEDMMKEVEALLISKKLLRKAAEGNDEKKLEYTLMIA